MENNFKKWRITHYPNKIGLFDTDQKTFLNRKNNVVLFFPFKDCILEGGMSEEFDEKLLDR